MLHQIHQILVCTTCASKWQDNCPVGTSGGTALWEYLSLHYPDLKAQFRILPVECMSACSHACVIAFIHPAKPTYLFGDLPHSPEALPSVGDALREYAGQYVTSTDGMVGWAQRPQLLKQTLLARIPPPCNNL